MAAVPDLWLVRAVVEVPLLCNDLIVTEYQLLEAWAEVPIWSCLMASCLSCDRLHDVAATWG